MSRKDSIMPRRTIRLIIAGVLIFAVLIALFAGGLGLYAHQEGLTWIQAFNLVWNAVFHH